MFHYVYIFFVLYVRVRTGVMMKKLNVFKFDWQSHFNLRMCLMKILSSSRNFLLILGSFYPNTFGKNLLRGRFKI